MARRRGASRVGCLFLLLLFVAIAYFGVNVGEAYLRYYRYRDAMEQEASFSSRKTDAEIRQTLAAFADTLGLPPEAHRVQIRRRPDAFTISADYFEQVELPLFVHDFHFHPAAESRP
jgi:hypothetical protein